MLNNKAMVPGNRYLVATGHNYKSRKVLYSIKTEEDVKIRENF